MVDFTVHSYKVITMYIDDTIEYVDSLVGFHKALRGKAQGGKRKNEKEQTKKRERRERERERERRRREK